MSVDTANERAARGTIVLAEDDDTTRQVLCRILRRAHFSVRAFENGQLAYDALQECQPDVILLDWMMPVMDGQKLVELLRADLAMRGIPVVMLTTHSQVEDRVTALESGVQDFLAKPCDSRELIARLDQQVRWRRIVALDANTQNSSQRLALYRGALTAKRPNDAGDFLDRIWGKRA